MKKLVLSMLLVGVVWTSTGCDWSEVLLGNIYGWDVSACGHYPSACFELFIDNYDNLDIIPPT